MAGLFATEGRSVKVDGKKSLSPKQARAIFFAVNANPGKFGAKVADGKATVTVAGKKIVIDKDHPFESIQGSKLTMADYQTFRDENPYTPKSKLGKF